MAGSARVGQVDMVTRKSSNLQALVDAEMAVKLAECGRKMKQC
jgi:hypothetical protein